MQTAAESGADAHVVSELEAAAEEAKEQAEKAVRRAAKDRAKAEDAAREAETLGAKPDNESKEPTESSNSENDKDPKLP